MFRYLLKKKRVFIEVLKSNVDCCVLQVSSFANKSLEMSLRVVSLDYLGVVAARLRKDAVQSNLKLSTIDQIINEIKSEELKDDDGNMKVRISFDLISFT